MNKKNCALIFCASLIFLTHNSMAQTRDRAQVPTTTGVQASDLGGSNGSFQNAAQTTARTQSSGQTTGVAISSALIGGGTAMVIASSPCYCNKLGWAMIAGGGIGLVSSAKMGSDSGSNQNLANQFNTGSVTPSTPLTPTTTAINDPVIKDSIKKLSSAGYKLDLSKGTVSGPNGTQALTDMASPDALSKLSAADQASLKKAIDDASKKAKASAGTDSFSDGIVAGGGGAGGGGETAGGGAGGTFAGGKDHLGINRDPAQVAGLSTMYNGEPIGVASDSIFGIVDRRYDLHSKKGSFLGVSGH